MQVRRFLDLFFFGPEGVLFRRTPLNLEPLRHNRSLGIGFISMDSLNKISPRSCLILGSNGLFRSFRLPRVPTSLAGTRRGEVMPPICRLAIQATM